MTNSVPNRIPIPPGHMTWHMAPIAVWERQRGLELYVPERFDEEGFIHCTDDLDELLAVGNRYYRDDSREYVAIKINCDRVSAQIVYEDAQRMFPHIYGPLDVAAVRQVAALARSERGEFIGVDHDHKA